MSGRSYEKINYGLRPAKCIERKMLCEVFQRLSDFGAVETYRYVGFGSTYFSDFYLFHKNLGINNMVSIESDVGNSERFEFNRPFKCIDIRFGDSTEILPTLGWNVRTILWLDYDGVLNDGVLADIGFSCTAAVPGSVILITVNVQPDKTTEDEKDSITKLKDRVGSHKVPVDLLEKRQLAGWGTASVCTKIIKNEINEILCARNGALPNGSRILFKQLFHFHYADGSRMLTLGGLLYEEGQSHIVAKCAFDNLPFINEDGSAYLIEVPSLTYRELRYLDTQLPKGDNELNAPGLSREDLEKYARLYRYFPMFAETEI